MKVSREWLQKYFDEPLPDSNAIAEALTFHAFEIESVENDVLDIKVTANRGHDCLSHRGIAKELSAILKRPMNADPFREAVSFEAKTDAVSVIVADPELCPRYIACYIRGVKVGPSPEWLKKLLESIGQKSINNVVDATNAKMFNLGQPLHAFDAGQLKAIDGKYSIEVRRARAGEKMLALDDKEYTFRDSMLLITDANHRGVASPIGVPIGIAGVKGGKPAGVSEETTDIIIESANFNAVSVRKTAQALKLRTDASSRYEQDISPEMAGAGMKAVVELILELAGGEVIGFAEAYPKKPMSRTVSVTLEKINRVLGIKLSVEEVADTFTRLDLSFQQHGSMFTITPPFERLDLNIPEDLIEEVGRIIGYDNVPGVALPPAMHVSVNQDFAAREQVRDWLLSEGFSEVLTSVFAEKGERVVANKVDGVRPYLRSELLTGLREALDKNVRNKELLGEKQIKIFEIGTVWRKGEEIEMLGLAVERVKKLKTTSEYADQLDRALGGKGVASVPEEVIEIPLKEIAQQYAQKERYEPLEPSHAERYQPYSKFPFIVRDVAFWTNGKLYESNIRGLIKNASGDLLARLDQFDRFEKEGRISYGFRLVFQSFDKTLTDGEANERMESVYDALKKEGFEIR